MRIICSAPIFLIGFLLLFLPACAAEPTAISPNVTGRDTSIIPETISPTVSSSPSPPLKANLSISKLPVLNEPVDLICMVKSIFDASNITAQIKLPKGAFLISGNLQWQGNLKADIPVSFSAQIVFKETGHQIIEAITTQVIDDKTLVGYQDSIYLDIGVDTSTFGWPTSPAQITRVPDKYTDIQTSLEISHPPKLNEPAKLFITIVAPVNLPGLTAEIIFYKGVELLQGTTKQPVDLKAGVPVHFTATIVFRETGFHTVTADVAEQIDGVWHHSSQDTIYLNIGVDESTFENAPGIETSPENLPTPPAVPLPH